MPDPEPYISIHVFHDETASPLWLMELNDVEGTESTENGTKGYWPKEHWDDIEGILIQKLKKNNFSDFQVEEIPFINWNAEWESGFQPIRVSDFCFIRAPFHAPVEDVEHEIIVDPKMAFGTGHHATTWQMIDKMSHLDFNNKVVLDYGAGTGILAILAKKMGARNVWAIDNDPLAYENMLENFKNNDTPGITAKHATQEQLEHSGFDIILANINRNVLLDSQKGLTTRANPKSKLLMSGFYTEELPMITEKYKADWTLIDHTEKEQWCCAHFSSKSIS